MIKLVNTKKVNVIEKTDEEKEAEKNAPKEKIDLKAKAKKIAKGAGLLLTGAALGALVAVTRPKTEEEIEPEGFEPEQDFVPAEDAAPSEPETDYQL